MKCAICWLSRVIVTTLELATNSIQKVQMMRAKKKLTHFHITKNGWKPQTNSHYMTSNNVQNIATLLYNSQTN